MTAPKIIQRKLLDLRLKLTSWLMVHGMGRWLLITLAILGFSMLIDRVFKMDLAQRGIMLTVISLASLGYFVYLVLRPLLARVSDDALLLQVERKNPQLREQLISSWQLSREQDSGFLQRTGASEQLTTATIRDGLAAAEGIDFWRSLDLPIHRRDWGLLIAGLSLFLLLGIGVLQHDFFRTWFHRNVLLRNDSWPQGTYLEIAGAEQGRLTLPRGSDHRQLVFVTENSSVTDVNVTLEIETDTGRSLQVMKPTGRLEGREHATILYNVASGFRMRASGGDEVTDWVDVDLVEPPMALELTLRATSPAYTQQQVEEFTGSGPHPILRDSALEVQVEVNKPVAHASLVFAADQRSDGLNLLPAGNSQLVARLSPQQLRGGEYQIFLEDENGLGNVRPIKFNLSIKEDQPPRVRASLLGISGMVVPQARLPLAYQVVDDYGIARLFFDARWSNLDRSSEEQPEMLDGQVPLADLTGFHPVVRERQGDALLDLVALPLKPGMSFRFSLAAADTQPNVSGIGNSQEFLLRVVTNEELRADLLRREIEQRKAFEQAYESQMDLLAQVQMVPLQTPAGDAPDPAFFNQLELELIAMVRNQRGIGTSIARVADRFEEFLVEVKNNRLDEIENELFPEQNIETRFDRKIIQPIRQLDQELIALATRHIDQCRIDASRQAELINAASQANLVQQRILEEMKRILDAMNDSENFQELVNDLLRIKEDSRSLKLDIEKRAQPKGIFDDDSDLFDN
jgi:hypothetical protein